MTARAPLLRRLRASSAGVTIVEFGMVAPVMCFLLVGALDIAHSLYMRVALEGVVQKTARDSALENGSETAVQNRLDGAVKDQVHALASNADVAISRRYYRTFTSAAAQRHEDFTDTNHNGRCDNGEPYQDDNENQVWDKDGGNGGQGGAKDATLYTVTVSYPRILPVWKFIGGDQTTVIRAETVLKNQPFGDQASYGTPVVRYCP